MNCPALSDFIGEEKYRCSRFRSPTLLFTLAKVAQLLMEKPMRSYLEAKMILGLMRTPGEQIWSKRKHCDRQTGVILSDLAQTEQLRKSRYFFNNIFVQVAKAKLFTIMRHWPFFRLLDRFIFLSGLCRATCWLSRHLG